MGRFLGVTVDLDSVEINMAFAKFAWPDLEQLQPWLKEQGILIGAYTDPEMRFVTHYGISKEYVDQLILCLKTFKDRKCG